MTEQKVRITVEEIEIYKREVLEQSVLVTIPAAAQVLSVHPRTVKRLINDGEIHAYNRRGGGSLGTRLLASELREYVRSIRIHPDTWKE